jgi:4-amino-4-deoxy-L-arabinose transferase-like glycosyltransferase
VTWWVAGDKPLFLWSYLGPVFAEIGYQLGGASGVGPRIMALLGGVIAATMALGWLIDRKVPGAIASLLALAFLLDPLFTLSQRMARSDSWVMAFCLGSCWLLSISASKNGALKVMLIMLAGVLAAIASFVWPSAVFLYPLICLEFLRSIYDNESIRKSFKQFILCSLYFLAGGLLTSIVLIIPISQQLPLIVGDMKNMIALNVNATKTPAERLLTLFSYQPWAKVIKSFAKTLSPGLPLMAIWASLFRREMGLVVASFFTLSIIFMTLVYEFRILYLTPYFLAMSGELFRRLGLSPVKSIFKRVSNGLLILVVVWSIVISIFLRSILAINDGSLHDRSMISNAATSAIGYGNYKVFLAFTYEFYFTGRSLGWQLYTPYIQFTYDSAGNWIRKDDFQPRGNFIKLMSKMDYAIFTKGQVNDAIARQLQLSGLNYKATIHISDGLISKTNSSSPDRTSNIILWFLRGADSYGPYLLYARPKITCRNNARNIEFLNTK